MASALYSHMCDRPVSPQRRMCLPFTNSYFYYCVTLLVLCRQDQLSRNACGMLILMRCFLAAMQLCTNAFYSASSTSALHPTHAPSA